MTMFGRERRGMVCKIALADGEPCNKVAMYYAGDDGFCFDHKAEAVVATEKVKKRYASKKSVEEFQGHQDALSGIRRSRRSVYSELMMPGQIRRGRGMDYL